jgi:hypothetical protein
VYEKCELFNSQGIDLIPFVEAGAITSEQYEQITGKQFKKES